MVKYRKTDNQCEFYLAWRKKNKQLYIEVCFVTVYECFPTGMYMQHMRVEAKRGC